MDLLRAFIRFSADRPELDRIINLEATAPSERLDWLVATHLQPRFEAVAVGWERLRSEGVGADLSAGEVWEVITSYGAMHFANAPMLTLLGIHGGDGRPESEAHAARVLAVPLPRHRPTLPHPRRRTPDANRRTARRGALGPAVPWWPVSVLVDLQGVGVTMADRALFGDLAVTVATGDRLGVVGINGTGKSTLLRVLAGRLDTRRRRGPARAAACGSATSTRSPSCRPAPWRTPSGPGWEAAAALDRLGMGGARRRRRGRRCRAARPSGSPWPGCSPTRPTCWSSTSPPTTSTWARSPGSRTGWPRYTGGLVLVSHDRYLLDRVTTRMLELDRGAAYVHEGGYASYLEARADREEQAARGRGDPQEPGPHRAGLAPPRGQGPQPQAPGPDRRGPGARRRPARPRRRGRATSSSSAAMTRLGDKVIECTGVGVAYDDRYRRCCRDVDLRARPRRPAGRRRRQRDGQVDAARPAGRPAGCPTTGTVDAGPTVVVGYYDQHGAELDPAARVQEVVAGPHRTPGSLADVALMKRFWFTGNLPYTRVGDLSGGERRRLQLLAVLARRPNVLLLDEPTNDLDLDTLRILEDFLDDWPGRSSWSATTGPSSTAPSRRWWPSAPTAWRRSPAGSTPGWPGCTAPPARATRRRPRWRPRRAATAAWPRPSDGPPLGRTPA